MQRKKRSPHTSGPTRGSLWYNKGPQSEGLKQWKWNLFQIWSLEVQTKVYAESREGESVPGHSSGWWLLATIVVP